MHYEWGVVDVRDVARAHVAAVTNPKASGRSERAEGRTLPAGLVLTCLPAVTVVGGGGWRPEEQVHVQQRHHELPRHRQLRE